jgi:glycosyltransferase involved in cell wall biosynthesis
MAPKICVYAISLNEEKHVEKFYQSCKDADMVLIADTGSTDQTVKIAKKLGIKTHAISVKPWRFDTARNIALGLIPSDYDICISMDLDEVLTPGWRECVLDAWRPGVSRIQYRYEFAPGYQFNATKIHSRYGYNWANICHEMIQPDSRHKEVWSFIEDLLIVHHQDTSKGRQQYLPMLMAGVKENPANNRDSWYLAREYWYMKEYQKCIDEFERYLALPTAVWHHERSFALRCQGKSYLELGLVTEAFDRLRLAVNTSRQCRDPWLDLAQACYTQSAWHECFYAATQALTITTREFVFTSDAEPWGPRLYDLAALSAYNLGMKDTAIKYGQLALDMNPADTRLQTNQKYYRT